MENENENVTPPEDGEYPPVEPEHYKTIFGDADFAALRRIHFRGKAGNIITIARLIYNGFSHNLGTVDGAVVIKNNYSVWQFIAPAGRWVVDDFTGKSLSEALQLVGEDSAVVPVPAWDDFCGFLRDPEIEMNVNQILHGSTSSIKVAYKKTESPLIKGIVDFPSFARWLYEHTGEAGETPAEQFAIGQSINIPADLYKSTPVSFTLKTPTEQPTYVKEVDVLAGDGVTAVYAAHEGAIEQPIFYCAVDSTTYIYAFEQTTDPDGVVVPQGWSVFDGSAYIPYDMEANPVVIPYVEGLEWSYLAKAFADIQWETTTETTYRIKNTIDLSAFAGEEFMFYGAGTTYEFQVVYSETESVYGIALMYSTEIEQRIYHYVDKDTEYEGITIPKGWSVLVEDDSEAGAHCEPYDMEANPLTVSILDGMYETTNESLSAEIADFVEETTAVKEELSGTITFLFTF